MNRAAIVAFNSKVNAILKEAGHPYEYKGTSEITHFLWVLDDHPELFEGKVTDALQGTKIAAYYGCATPCIWLPHPAPAGHHAP